MIIKQYVQRFRKAFNHPRRKPFYRPQLERLEDRLTPSTHTWTGAQSELWSNNGNWVGNAPMGDPVADLVFPHDGVTNKTSKDDYLGHINIQSIQLDGDTFILSGVGGASISLLRDIIDNSPGDNSVELNMDLPDDHLHNHEVKLESNANLTMSGDISGPPQSHSALVPGGQGGKLLLTGHNTFAAGMVIGKATVTIMGDNVFPARAPLGIQGEGRLELIDNIVEASELAGLGTISLVQDSLLTLYGDSNIFAGTIVGSGKLSVAQDSVVELDGNNTYSGETGVIGTLRGSGSVGLIICYGTVNPGSSRSVTGTLSSGLTEFTPDSKFKVRLNGTTPGTQYDSLAVDGAVYLNQYGSQSPTLDASLGFASHLGDTFTILTSTGGITGTFAGLPDGANFGVNGTPMQIHYTGTSVVLTHRPQFLPPVTYGVISQGPNLVAVGDFRGNGVKDLVTSNRVDSSVKVFLGNVDSLGNGDGTFSQHALSSTNTDPYATSLTVGDFNGDGKLDIVTTSYVYPSLSVLLGNGDGTFQTAHTYPLGRPPNAVAVGHFHDDPNHPNILDLVTANYDQSSVSVLLGKGDGTFQPAVTYDVGLHPTSVAVGDFRGNGTLDIVTGNGGGHSVTVLLGNGDGTFDQITAQDYQAGYVSAVAVGDFRGNGMLDIITVNGAQGQGTVSVLLGNGHGTFAGAQNTYLGDYPTDLALGDFDADGKLDVVVTIYSPTSSPGLALLYGRGDGFFQAPIHYDLPPIMYNLVADSFQGRGNRFQDVAVISAGVVSVLLNVGDGSVPAPGPPGEHPHPAAAVGRFPGDAFPLLAGPGTGLRASPNLDAATTSVIPWLRALPQVLDVAGVDLFFAAAAEPDRAFGWPPSKREAWLGADEWWVDGPGKDGALLDRTLWALPTT
jgi:hypothetical protein